MKQRLLFPLILSIYSICSQSSAQEPGSVQGAVLDEEGKSVVAAHVQVEPLGKVLSSPVRETETDKTGHFLIDNLQLGSYKTFAMKESAGYPDTAFAFYSNQVFSTVTLTTNAPKVDLMLKIGPPSGVVNGLVTNAITQELVSASFLLRRASDFENWISLSQRPQYRVLLPPNTDVLLEVSAAGYKTLYYGGPSDPLGRPAIRLNSGQEMKLDIQLQPVVSESKK